MLEETVGAVMAGFGSETLYTGLAIIVDEVSDVGPRIFAMNEVQCLILTGVTGEDVVMLSLNDVQTEVLVVRDIDTFVQP